MTLDVVTAKLLSTTDSSEWEHVRTIDLHFETDHPQGVIRVGERYFLSTVRIPTTPDGAPDKTAPGKGFLIEVAPGGEEKARLELCDGMVYHPGGIATDGDYLYVPVSEYRPDSSCHVYKVDVETFTIVGEPVRFPDHLGALSLDPERRRFFGMSWASEKIYVWDFEWNLLYMNQNPVMNVGYQDMDYLGANLLACGGVQKHQLGGEEIEIGGIDLINSTTWLPEHRIMVTTRTATGRLLSNNAFSHRFIYPDLFVFFIPDDDQHSTVEVYRV
jgi:hypothetical protein